MRFKLTTLVLVFSFLIVGGSAIAAGPSLTHSADEAWYGGGKEKDKKNKDAEAQAKMKKRRGYNPKKYAKASAKSAKQANASKHKQIMYRASVRNFFHRTFNAKPGKYRNFRSKRQRRRWSKGR